MYVVIATRGDRTGLVVPAADGTDVEEARGTWMAVDPIAWDAVQWAHRRGILPTIEAAALTPTT